MRAPIRRAAARARIADVEPSTAPALGAPGAPQTPALTILPSNDVDGHLGMLPMSIIIKSLHIFRTNFPEMNMLHPDLFSRLFLSDRKANSKALLAALLAAIKKEECYIDGTWMNQLLPSEEYTSFSRGILSNAMLGPPEVVVVQAHLILTLYECGVRDFQKAWVHCGIAIRIMQSLHSTRRAPFSLDETTNVEKPEELSQIVETATYWACFILDCTINSGTYNPRMLSMAEMIKLQVPRSPPTSGFLFGFKQKPMAERSLSMGIEECYEVLVDGFAIYADVMAFVYNDGRKAPGIVASHANTGCRAFFYINLLYYHCVLMLNREYFPFLPKPHAGPQGPTDPPFLEAEAPPRYWENSAKELFEAAAHVATILRDALQWGMTMMTPVPGFCGFSLSLPKAKEHLDMGLAYLKEFRKAWNLGEGWIQTIQNASKSFEQVNSNVDRYRHRSRLDFEVLHQSAHEFRTVDRSEQHMAMIRGAEQGDTQSINVGEDNSDALRDSEDLENFDPVALLGDQASWPTWYSAPLENELFGSVTVQLP
ncbi:fungal specific transcription factor [Colletotrichum asianum]|uniref:Fungal specific transcription factor n=1 Tax=Colletotrichum asianum TaxID=702518 RepID=A0A8H3W3H0_9PEZI|nr:fungal specific transcription factor [Colletotrichum asianum]